MNNKMWFILSVLCLKNMKLIFYTKYTQYCHFFNSTQLWPTHQNISIMWSVTFGTTYVFTVCVDQNNRKWERKEKWWERKREVEKIESKRKIEITGKRQTKGAWERDRDNSEQGKRERDETQCCMSIWFFSNHTFQWPHLSINIHCSCQMVQLMNSSYWLAVGGWNAQ